MSGVFKLKVEADTLKALALNRRQLEKVTIKMFRLFKKDHELMMSLFKDVKIVDNSVGKPKGKRRKK